MAPPHLQHVNPERVAELLDACLHEGCRASSLRRSAAGRELIDLLVPEHCFPSYSEVERAFATQQLLVSACAEWESPRGEAAQMVLGLKSGFLGRTVTQRRQAVSTLLGNSGDGFRRRREDGVLNDIAFEAIRLAADLPFTEPQLRLHLVG